MLGRHISGRALLLVLMESFLLFSGVLLAAWVHFDFSWEKTVAFGVIPKALFITAVCQVVLYYSDLYALKGKKNLRENFLSFFQAMGLSYVVLALFYFLIPELVIGRGIGVLSFIFLFLLLILWRNAFDRFLVNPQMKEKVLIVGTGEMAARIAREILNDPGCGLFIEGFVSPERDEVGRSIINPRVLGAVEDLHSVVARHKIDRIVVALDQRRQALPVREILQCKLEGVKVQEGANLLEQISGKISVKELRPSWIIFSEGFHRTAFLNQVKRVIDLLFSGIFLVVLWPVMLAVALAVKMDSRGPVFYRQERVGQWGKNFTLLKFRSMCADAEADGPKWASESDARVTRVGRVIRKVRLDELPQLVNVLKGHMSLVGPRPERPEFVVKLREKIPFYDQRHSVKPGITGWAQVKFMYGNTIEDSLEKLEYDLFYIKNLSIPLDLLIIFQTVKVVLLGRGAL